jgi:large conductance mechanosensitive channel
MTNPQRMKKMSGFWQEFKRFAVKGNALELAVAVVVGTAFTQIVNSLVGDIITPLLGLLSPGNVDFKNYALVLRSGYSINGAVVPPLLLRYGSFVSSIVNFLVISLAIFLFFQLFAMMRRRFFTSGEEEKTPEHEKPAQERLLEEIRDLLKEQMTRR